MIRAAVLDAATTRWAVEDAGSRPRSFGDVIEGWRLDCGFRAAWCAALRDVAFRAYAWECPPVTERTLSRAFECVFVDSPALEAMPPEPEAFAGHFRPGREAATFGNLGGDATLVAPCPESGDADYAHLARFTATAPAARQAALWQAVGAAMGKRVGERPVWLSTAGLGVGWLHVRLDDRPKYYRHAAYAWPIGSA